ncbi:ArnT family glycosyltransferase [Candidatus Uabimicrobium sp. HlEnr_7]|uniref:ArnT family glycosyltransferase n=1 Tax=Candidatus Uabimicrobium helgolandensis TaxID=3095367 RepID=UPI00355721E6
MKAKHIFLFIFVFLSVSVSLKYSGLRVQDGYDYAQLARNINNGKLFHSSVTIPLTVEKQKQQNIDMWRPPVYPLMIAVFFKIFGSSEIAILILCMFAHLAFVAIVFVLARSMYNEKTAVIASALIGFSPEICWYTLNCLREPVFCLLFSLCVYLLHRCKKPYLLGFSCAITYLTRYNFLFFLPSIAVYLLLQYKDKHIKKEFLIKVACAFFIGLSPWCIRNISNDLSPFFTLQRHEVALFTSDYPHYTVYRNLKVESPLEYVYNNPNSVLEKTLYYSWLYYWPQAVGLNPLHTNKIPSFFFPKWQKIGALPQENSWANFTRVQNRQFSLYSLIFLVALFSLLFYKNNSQKSFYFVFIIGILLQILVLSFIHPVIRHCLPFITVGTIFVCGEYLSRICWKKLYILIFGCAALSTITILNTSSGSQLQKLPTQQSMAFIKENTKEDSCIATNIPFELSWRTNRQALWLPVQKEDYLELEKKYPTCRYFYYHSRKENDWLNTSPQLKEYLRLNYRCIYQYEKGRFVIYFFEKK